MGIDEAREDIAARRVDHFGAGRRGQVAPDPGYRFALAVNVCDVAFARGDDFAVLDEERHGQYVARCLAEGNWVEE